MDQVGFEDDLDTTRNGSEVRTIGLQKLFLDDQRLRCAIACMGDGVLITDTAAAISYLNPVGEALLGWSNGEAKTLGLQQLFNLVSESAREVVTNPVISCLETRKVAHLADDTILIRRDGSERFIDDSAAPITNGEGELIGAVLVFRDVTDTRHLLYKLRYQALHDSLTGLENRRGFELAVSEKLRQNADHCTGSLLYVDLDQFKVVNDTAGHAAGDRLLCEVATLMRSQLRSQDKLARLGGDEFGILLDDGGTGEALKVADRLLAAIRNFRFPCDDRFFTVSGSIGVVPVLPVGETLSNLFVAADNSCYAAKEEGGDRVHLFDVTDIAILQRHGEMEWVERINNALRADRFCLYQQSIVPLNAGPLTEQWTEILLRMVDEGGEIIPPADFIPAAERFGLIAAIDRWVFAQTLQNIQSFTSLPEIHRTYSINVSGPSLSDESFLRFVSEKLANTGIDPAQLCFEITETAAIKSVSHAMRFVSLLKGLGCRILLDDFGTGLSSFAYLRTLSVDYMKIPGRFVKNMMTDQLDYAMVEGIFRLSRMMGIQVIAEHIESEETRYGLQSLGVDYGQGYLFDAPKPMMAQTARAGG